MAYFLNREEPVRGSGKRNSQAGPGRFIKPDDPVGAASPPSRLVRDGYAAGGDRAAAGERPPVADKKSGGFDADVARQWEGSVEEQRAAHQQIHDPNVLKIKPKTNGFRVAQPAGGQSSLSLAWDAPPGSTDQPGHRQRGRGNPVDNGSVVGEALEGNPEQGGGGGAATPPKRHAPPSQSGLHSGMPPRRVASPGGAHAGAGGGRGPGNAGNGMSGKRDDRNEHRGSVDSGGRPAPLGDDDGYGQKRDNDRPVHREAPSPSGMKGREGLSKQEAYAIENNRQRSNCGHSGGNSGIGNSYGGGAGNGSQNTGNKIGDRNSTRVLAPPGGFTSFTLG